MNIEGHQKCNSFREKIKEKKCQKNFAVSEKVLIFATTKSKVQT